METLPWTLVRDYLLSDDLGDSHVHGLRFPAHGLDLSMIRTENLEIFEIRMSGVEEYGSDPKQAGKRGSVNEMLKDQPEPKTGTFLDEPVD